MAADKKKTCVCNPISCRRQGTELCNDYKCTTCRACCHPDCKGCEKKCKKGDKCKCFSIICGCKDNCYKDGNNGECLGKKNNSCQRCQTKCTDGKPCICYQCNCGTQCNGFLCACCYFCNPGRCKRKGTCDGFVLGKCGPGGCKGHGTYDDEGRPVYVDNCNCGPKGSGEDCKCYTSERDPNDKKCRCIRGDFQDGENCLGQCDTCGTLCRQHTFFRRCTIAGVLIAVAMVMFFVWSKHRDKFLKIFYELRGSFSRAPKHSSAYTNNLIGDRLPEEGNIDRYPAFRPRTYAGLS